MKQETRSILGSIMSVLASLPWGGIIPNVLILLGLAGSAAATWFRESSSWLFPLLLCASILLIGRSFYMIYVHKTASRTTTIVAWCSLTFMASYWSWYFLLGGHVILENLMRPDEGQTPLVASTDDDKAKEDAKDTGDHGIKDVKLHVEGMKAKWHGDGGQNSVKKALLGLKGVETVDWDWESDTLQVRFDTSKVTPGDMLNAVAREKFKGKVMP